MGIPEREERVRGTESPCKKVIDDNFPMLWKELDPRIQKLTEHLIISTQKFLLHDTLY